MSAATPVRRSRRLAAKPTVNYSELEEDEVIHTPKPSPLPVKEEEVSPVVSISIRVAEEMGPTEKARHAVRIHELLSKVVNSKGTPAKVAVAIELMQYILTCKAFCDTHSQFRDTVVAKCYELKKYNGAEYPALASACNAVLHMFGKPLEVPTIMPVVLPKGSCGDCHGCKKQEEKLRTEMEARHAKKEAPAQVAPVDNIFLRQQLRRIQGEMEDAETEGYFHSIVDDYLAYVRKPEVLAALKASPSDRMIARGIIRQYENDLCGHHEAAMEEFLKLCPV